MAAHLVQKFGEPARWVLNWGKAMFQMMGVFAEFERAMIQERVRAGLVRNEGRQEVRAPADRWRSEKDIRKALQNGQHGHAEDSG